MCYGMTLFELTNAVEEYMKNKKYAASTVLTYRYIWNQLELFARMENVNTYSFEYGLRFVKERYGVDLIELNPPFSERQLHLYRTMKSLDEFQRGVPISVYKKPPKQPLPEPYKGLIENYLTYYGERNLSRRSIDMAAYTLRKFAEFLNETGIKNLNDITATNLCDFSATLKDYVASTRNSWLSRIKDFLKFAYEEKYTDKKLFTFVPKPKYMPTSPLPSVYSREEIERILNAVDTANPIGKRDYAILKLAANLGIRSGDIANLKYENFDWNKNEIHFIQQKGGYPHTLPLLNDVGESIIDYLKNGRPQIDSTYIFFKHSAPYTELTSSALHHIMTKYRRLAKLPTDPPRKNGLHALRHSLASSLLENATPLPVISEVLGHQKTETTAIYTRIDIDSLRKCALENPV